MPDHFEKRPLHHSILELCIWMVICIPMIGLVNYATDTQKCSSVPEVVNEVVNEQTVNIGDLSFVLTDDLILKNFMIKNYDTHQSDIELHIHFEKDRCTCKPTKIEWKDSDCAKILLSETNKEIQDYDDMYVELYLVETPYGIRIKIDTDTGVQCRMNLVVKKNLFFDENIIGTNPWDVFVGVESDLSINKSQFRQHTFKVTEGFGSINIPVIAMTKTIDNVEYIQKEFRIQKDIINYGLFGLGKITWRIIFFISNWFSNNEFMNSLLLAILIIVCILSICLNIMKLIAEKYYKYDIKKIEKQDTEEIKKQVKFTILSFIPQIIVSFLMLQNVGLCMNLFGVSFLWMDDLLSCSSFSLFDCLEFFGIEVGKYIRILDVPVIIFLNICLFVVMKYFSDEVTSDKKVSLGTQFALFYILFALLLKNWLQNIRAIVLLLLNFINLLFSISKKWFLEYI